MLIERMKHFQNMASLKIQSAEANVESTMQVSQLHITFRPNYIHILIVVLFLVVVSFPTFGKMWFGL